MFLNLFIPVASIIFLAVVEEFWCIPLRVEFWALAVIVTCAFCTVNSNLNIREGFLSIILGVIFALLLNELMMTSRRHFMRDLFSIEPGSSTTMVMNKMGRYIKGTGVPAFQDMGKSGSIIDDNLGVNYGYTRFEQDKDAGMGIRTFAFRHDISHWYYNGDIGIVETQSNKVKRVRFLPD